MLEDLIRLREELEKKRTKKYIFDRLEPCFSTVESPIKGNLMTESEINELVNTDKAIEDFESIISKIIEECYEGGHSVSEISFFMYFHFALTEDFAKGKRIKETYSDYLNKNQDDYWNKFKLEYDEYLRNNIHSNVLNNIVKLELWLCKLTDNTGIEYFQDVPDIDDFFEKYGEEELLEESYVNYPEFIEKLTAQGYVFDENIPKFEDLIEYTLNHEEYKNEVIISADLLKIKKPDDKKIGSM